MNDLCLNCFQVKGQYEVCPYCGHVEGTPPKAAYHLTPGTVLAGHFLVGTAIAETSGDISYRCYDQTLGVVVVVKEFFPQGMAYRNLGETMVGLTDPSMEETFQASRTQFMAEAQRMVRFGKAKDILNVYDTLEENNTAYIVMEYVRAGRLSDLMEQGPIDPGRAVNITISILHAVRKLHAEGMLHLNLTPRSVFVMEDNSIKLFDFGSAYAMEQERARGVDNLHAPGYAAPELYQGGDLGLYTDVYSVGALLYRMITGREPVPAPDRMKQKQDDMPSPLKLGFTIDPNLDCAIMEAMAVDPTLRIPTVVHMEESLIGNRRAQYPGKKATTRKTAKYWLIGLVAAIVLVIGVGGTLAFNLLKPGNPLLEDKIAEGTEITVWVDDEETARNLESIAQTEFVTEVEGMDENTRELIEDNKHVSQVKVEVKEDMSGAIEGVKGTENMPDMFISDRVNLDGIETVSLKDSVYASLDRDKYFHMSETDYDKWFANGERIPTRLDTLLYYAYDVEGKKSFTSAFFGEQASTLDAGKLLDNGEEIFEIKNPYVELYGILMQPDCVDGTGKITENDSYKAIVSRLTGEKDAKAAVEFQGPKGTFGKGRVAGVGYRGSIPGYEDKDDNGRMRGHKEFLLISDNKALIQYTNCYSVSATAGESEQLACERLLWAMLGTAAQTNYGAQGDATTEIPIRKEAVDNYFTYSGIPESVKDYLGADGILTGCKVSDDNNK